ncbi:hypothetical protein [Gluconobacter morbifer]|uniref:FeoB-associated Cys-rich membrane protein n=1 Tax=Gluconobacter morbifer G707 TaxID=1088869 RepID=G6XEY4_9PROT|nr:hypothetical protein [Gluconobacter morbifer]EHH68742.1 hypothetical protein GMO_00490 [Gluconobacter morbifer G707]
MMIEFAVVALIVCLAGLYWYARLFPSGWRKLRASVGLPAVSTVPAKGKGCGGCSGCGSSNKSCH